MKQIWLVEAISDAKCRKNWKQFYRDV